MRFLVDANLPRSSTNEANYFVNIDFKFELKIEGAAKQVS
jgi:hypothetical protein